MSDNTAILAGFTDEYFAESSNSAYTAHIWVKPETDLDGRFKAYDADECEWIVINGWNWSFELIQSYPQGWAVAG